MRKPLVVWRRSEDRSQWPRGPRWALPRPSRRPRQGRFSLRQGLFDDRPGRRICLPSTTFRCLSTAARKSRSPWTRLPSSRGASSTTPPASRLFPAGFRMEGSPGRADEPRAQFDAWLAKEGQLQIRPDGRFEFGSQPPGAAVRLKDLGGGLWRSEARPGDRPPRRAIQTARNPAAQDGSAGPSHRLGQAARCPWKTGCRR